MTANSSKNATSANGSLSEIKFAKFLSFLFASQGLTRQLLDGVATLRLSGPLRLPRPERSKSRAPTIHRP